MPSPYPSLPATYYHDHFSEMIGFVTSVYGTVLSAEDRDFIAGFEKLSLEAQCLFIRMSNRQKDIFHLDHLRYAEIEDRDKAVAELIDRDFARVMQEKDYRACLLSMTREALAAVARRHGLGIKVAWAKRRTAAYLLEALTYKEFLRDTNPTDYIVPLHRDRFAFLLYLYFGRLGDGLTSFALRDLGIVSVKARASYRSRFQDIAEAQAGFFYSQLARQLKNGDEAFFLSLAEKMHDFPAALSDFARELRDSVLFALGQFFEKRKNHSMAVSIYERSQSFDSRERVVRLLHAGGETARAAEMLDAMMANPAHDEEYLFASDFFGRKFGQRRIGIYTDLLRQGETIEVDDLYRGYPEFAAIRHFESLGWSCHHTENGLWPTLFGLVFWDELFEDGDDYASSFDRLPHSLKTRGFHLRHADSLKRKLDAVRAREAGAIVEATIAARRDRDNGLFYWFEGLEELMEQLVSSSPPAALAAILEAMAGDFYASRDGFPDLMMTRDGCIKFIEIKAEGDQVRRNQLARLALLKRAGYEAEICRVAYRVDPAQTYVVVDVETTGGRPPYDRMTEIAAVKIRDGVTIDTFQTLLNPGRRIPVAITALTGITDDMVRTAPLFADIADRLEAFLDGSIFVAHNVNFDHGFIASEYTRLERRFRYPKLCTCASMRKYFPGHSSYGLANLCREYGIELKNHHRALADAQAAARLLQMVNEKRLETRRA